MCKQVFGQQPMNNLVAIRAHVSPKISVELVACFAKMPKLYGSTRLDSLRCRYSIIIIRCHYFCSRLVYFISSCACMFVVPQACPPTHCLLINLSRSVLRLPESKILTFLASAPCSSAFSGLCESCSSSIDRLCS